jgi:hypothetical protein
MEAEMRKMKRGFNEVIRECHTTTNVMINTLTNDIQYRLKAIEDALAIVTYRFKEDMVRRLGLQPKPMKTTFKTVNIGGLRVIGVAKTSH